METEEPLLNADCHPCFNSATAVKPWMTTRPAVTTAGRVVIHGFTAVAELKHGWRLTSDCGFGVFHGFTAVAELKRLNLN